MYKSEVNILIKLRQIAAALIFDGDDLLLSPQGRGNSKMLIRRSRLIHEVYSKKLVNDVGAPHDFTRRCNARFSRVEDTQR